MNVGMSFKYILNSFGARTDPWGTPAWTVFKDDNELFTLTLKVLIVRYERMVFMRQSLICNLINLLIRPICHTLSKAFFKSSNSTAVFLP